MASCSLYLPRIAGVLSTYSEHVLFFAGWYVYMLSTRQLAIACIGKAHCPPLPGRVHIGMHIGMYYLHEWRISSPG